MAKKKRTKNQGRSYEISEWVDAEIDSHLEGEAQETDLSVSDLEGNVEHTEGLGKAKERFTQEAVRVVEGWMEKHPKMAEGLAASDDVESDDDIAWNTWAHFVGHGVGFWEHMTNAEYKSLSEAIDKDKKLGSARGDLEIEIWNVAGEAVEKTKREGNPGTPPSATETRKLKNKLLR